MSASSLEAEEAKANALQEIFNHLKTNHMYLDQDSTLVLLDVDDTLVYLADNHGGGYNDFLMKKLRDLAQDPKVKFCLFTTMSLEDIKNPHAIEKRTDVLLRLKKDGIDIERVIMPGDLGHKHPFALELLEPEIAALEKELTEQMEKIVSPDFLDKEIAALERDMASQEKKEFSQLLTKQVAEIARTLALFRNSPKFLNKMASLNRLLEVFQSMYPRIETQNGKKDARNIEELIKELLIRVGALQRKETVSSNSFPHIAGSSFVDHYISAFESSDDARYAQCKNDNGCLAKLDREISQKFLPIDEKENTSEARHSKVRLVDTLFVDPHATIPGKIIFFDDRAECISSVDKRIEQINMTDRSKYRINFIGVHLQDRGKNHDVNQAAITNAVETHLFQKRIPFRADNLSSNDKEDVLKRIYRELNSKKNILGLYNKQVVPDLINLAKTQDAKALYYLAQIAAKGEFGLPLDPASAYYLGKLALCFPPSPEGENIIRQFIAELETRFPYLKNGGSISNQNFPRINGFLPSELYQCYIYIERK